MLQLGRSLHLGAANSGQLGALAVDVAYRTAEIAVQIAADVAISVVTMGAATPAVAAKWAATAATWAAKAANAATRVVRLAVTAAKYVGKQMVELASAAVKLGQHGWQMLKAGAKFTVENSGKLLSQAKNFAADVPGLLRTAATKAVQSTKTGLQALGRKTFDTVEKGVKTVVHGWFGESKLHNPLTRFANRLGFRACFVAGTPIRTLDGSKPIEEFKSYEEHGEDCDYVLARNEFDPNGPVRARRVLRKFVRVAPVLNLHVGGRVIGTTAEHPFFVEDKGWTPAFDLKIGDRVLLEDGQCLRVEGIANSGRVETVYNIEVEGDHTYFVGEQNWGWAVWSHNVACEEAEAIARNLTIVTSSAASNAFRNPQRLMSVLTQAHHPFFRMFLRSMRDAGFAVKYSTRLGSRFVSQSLAYLEPATHNIMHGAWNKFVRSKNLSFLQASRGNGKLLTRELSSNRMHPRDIFILLEEFYKGLAARNIDGAGDAWASIRLLRQRLGY